MTATSPPLAGMKEIPSGLPLMFDAWVGLVQWAMKVPECRDGFKTETGHDIVAFANEVAAGRAEVRDVPGEPVAPIMAAWADWVTVNLWGDGSDPDRVIEGVL
ncbi:hypothetical protein [Nevskia ramosa]|uniref:hypothetical protein n=1 Tax=Nevskia ramosa TaxID=64002 RepID=UPI003D10D48C